MRKIFLNKEYNRYRRKRKRWMLYVALGWLGGTVLMFLFISGILLYPYLNLPKVTATNLDRLNLENYKNVMIVAHPDGELLWGGKHLLEGDYFVVCLTHGYDKIRREEFRRILAETKDKGLILSYPDKIGKKRSDWKFWIDKIESDLKEILSYKDWEVVVTHNEEGEYGHQQHIMTHESVEKMYQEAGCKAKLFWFGTYYVDDKVPYDLMEMDKEVYNQKRRLAKNYESQRSTIRKLYHMMPYEYWTEAQ